MACSVLLIAAGLVLLRSLLSTPTPAAQPLALNSTTAAGPATETTSAETEEQKRLKLFLGSWRDDYYGERTMTFAADGTGSMIIKLDSVGQAIYGEKLLFYLAWVIRDGILEMKFTGGEPKSAVETISKLWGDTHFQAIEVLTETDLHLRSTDSQNLYTLKRLPDESAASPPAGG